MPRKILKNKPLIEAIFELKWGLQEIRENVKIDPHYKILIGSLFSKLRDEYPYHEMLPAASIPDDIAGHVIQHRFRRGKSEWPLIQIGSGILTVNDTEGYKWEDFEKRINTAINALIESYPELENLKISSILLRYIDAVELDFDSTNIFDFLSQKMKIGITLNADFFNNTGVDSNPSSFDWRYSFPCKKPMGVIHLRFVRGKKDDKDALIWETMVQSTGENVPVIASGVADWLNSAHDLTDDWFFKLIEGELERRFE